MNFFDRRKNSRRREDHERDRLFELSSDLLAVLAVDGRVRQANIAWEQFLGFSMQELMERPILDFIHAEDQSAASRAFDKLRQSVDQLTFEARVKTRGGPARWLSWSATPDPENEAIYIAARDIMGRKLAEAQTARLAAIVESSNDAIVSASMSGMIESWNPAAERIFGYKAAEVLGKSLAVLVPRQSTDQTPVQMLQVGAGRAVAGIAADRRRKDGTMIRVSLTLSPVKDAAGHVVATSIIAREIPREE